MKIGNLQVRYGLLEDAIATFGRIHDSAPEHQELKRLLLDTLQRRAREVIGQGRGDIAISVLQRAHAVRQDDPGVRRLLASTLESCGRLAAAGEAYERLAEMEEGAESLRRAGRSYARAGESGSAIAAYSLAVQRDPREPRSWLALSRLLARESQWTDAVAALDALVELEPGNPDAWRRLAAGREQVGDSKGSAQAWEQLAGLQPTAPEPLIRAAGLHRLVGDLGAARKASRRTLERDPGNRQAATALYELACECGDWVEASHAARLRHERDPEEIQLLRAYARALTMAEAEGEALDRYRQLTELAPDNPDSWRPYAQLALRMGADHEAARALQEWVRLAPDEPDPIEKLARLRTRQRNWEAAAEQYRKLVDASPDRRRSGLAGLARSLERDGDPAGAAAAFARLVGEDPDDEHARTAAIRLLLCAGDIDSAFVKTLEFLHGSAPASRLEALARAITLQKAHGGIATRIRGVLDSTSRPDLALGRLALEIGSPGLGCRALAGAWTTQATQRATGRVEELQQAPVDSDMRASFERSALSLRLIVPSSASPQQGEPDTWSDVLVVLEAEADPEVVDHQLPVSASVTYVTEEKRPAVADMRLARGRKVVSVEEFFPQPGSVLDHEVTRIAQSVAHGVTSQLLAAMSAAAEASHEASTLPDPELFREASELLLESDLARRLRALVGFQCALERARCDAAVIVSNEGALAWTLMTLIDSSRLETSIYTCSGSRTLLRRHAFVSRYFGNDGRPNTARRSGAECLARDAAADPPPTICADIEGLLDGAVAPLSEGLARGSALLLTNLGHSVYRTVAVALLRQLSRTRPTVVKHFGGLGDNVIDVLRSEESARWEEAVALEAEPRVVAGATGAGTVTDGTSGLLRIACRGLCDAEPRLGVGAGVPVDHALEPLVELFTKRQLPYLIDLSRRAMLTLTVARPAYVLVSPGWTPAHRVVIAVARRLGIATIDVQALMVRRIPRYKRPNAKWCAVLDAAQQQLYEDHFGIDAEKIIQTGYVGLDVVRERLAALNIAQFRSGLGITDPGARVVLQATQPEPIDRHLPILEALLEALEDLDNRHLIVKLHPAEGPQRMRAYEDLARSRGAESWARVIRGEDIYSLIHISDLVVTRFSNVGIEAAALGRPVIAANLVADAWPIHLGELGVAVAANDRMSLVRAVRSRLESRSCPKSERIGGQEQRLPVGQDSAAEIVLRHAEQVQEAG